MSVIFVGDQEAAAEQAKASIAPKGNYYLKVVDCQQKKSKTAPNFYDMFALEYVVSEGEYEGLHVFSYLVLIPATKKGHGMTLRALHAHGFDPLGENVLEAEAFKGVTIHAKLDQEEYNDQWKNVIKGYIIPQHQEQVEQAAAQGEDPNGTAQEPEEAEVVPPLKAAAIKAGLVKAAPVAAKKPALPWKRK